MDLDNKITQLASVLGRQLLAQQLTVSMAESCTGGGIAEAITRVSGSSRWFEVGFVTYSNAVKAAFLGVDQAVLTKEGAVSQAVVEQMTAGTLLKSQADVVVAVSGIAGPEGGSKAKPVGTVWFSWATKQGVTVSEKQHFDGDRKRVRQQAVICALEGLVKLTTDSNTE